MTTIVAASGRNIAAGSLALLLARTARPAWAFGLASERPADLDGPCGAFSSSGATLSGLRQKRFAPVVGTPLAGAEASGLLRRGPIQGHPDRPQAYQSRPTEASTASKQSYQRLIRVARSTRCRTAESIPRCLSQNQSRARARSDQPCPRAAFALPDQPYSGDAVTASRPSRRWPGHAPACCSCREAVAQMRIMRLIRLLLRWAAIPFLAPPAGQLPGSILQATEQVATSSFGARFLVHQIVAALVRQIVD